MPAGIKTLSIWGWNLSTARLVESKIWKLHEEINHDVANKNISPAPPLQCIKVPRDAVTRNLKNLLVQTTQCVLDANNNEHS
ncbi:MAG: hypothetical protein EA369_07845 [Bradymonadales bacterium]|nr:MAG: hypothetical protein EA369_07845 [Bradymonadales bacterium]